MSEVAAKQVTPPPNVYAWLELIISIKRFSLNPIPASPSHLLFILPLSKKITVGTISTEYRSINSSLSSIMTRRKVSGCFSKYLSYIGRNARLNEHQDA